MAKRVANSTLNASTIDIMNVIRQNASFDYQNAVPPVQHATDIPKVGEVIYGTPAFANQFINALVNRIATVAVQSATFNNPYSVLKKGYLQFGESVEEIFVNIVRGMVFDPEQAVTREYARSIPDIKSAFHAMNWRVMYPVTIQDEDLRQAFLSIDGVQNLISKIVESVYTAAEYDEYLLFKYLLIKAVSGGKIYKQNLATSASSADTAETFRAVSNKLTFMNKTYNEAGVRTVTPRDRQVIFMDAAFNAHFDVDVLSAAFNMDKADFFGRLFLIDDWTNFDNERFEVIRAMSDGLEEVTADELAKMSGTKAIILDENWFQIYDNNNKFTEKYSASGLYWNYFYHTWKTISYSPFSNAVLVTTDNTAAVTPSYTISSVDKDEDGNSVINFADNYTELNPNGGTAFTFIHGFIQTEKRGGGVDSPVVAVQPYGSVIIPARFTSIDYSLILEVADKNGKKYKAKVSTLTPGTVVEFTAE